MANPLTIDFDTASFETVLQNFVQYTREQTRERPMITLISALAYAALGITAFEIVGAILPIPVIMPVIVKFANWAMFASLSWIAYHAVSTINERQQLAEAVQTRLGD